MSEIKKHSDKIFSSDVVRLKVDVVDWQGAVRASGDLLVNSGKCLPEYIDAMIQTVNTMGPYMVIAPGLALLHARPGDGVLMNGFSLITLKAPVEFGAPENDPVDIVISFCAINQTTHIAALEKLARFLRQDTNLTLLRQALNVENLITALNSQK